VITLPLSSLIRPREVGERSQSLSIVRGSKLRETDETHGVDNSRRYDKSPHYRKSRPYRDQTNCGPLEFVNRNLSRLPWGSKGTATLDRRI